MKKDSISVIIKVTNACNLKCRYCYDANESERNYTSLSHVGRLFELLADEYNTVNVIWHGGEPMLMGVDFYNEVLLIQKEYTNRAMFINKMQTNGTLIDKDWASFFVKNDFRVGISYDGGNSATGREQQERALRGRDKIIEANGQCGVVTVIDSQNVGELINIYEYYKEKHINAQFNCIFPFGRALENNNNFLMISADAYIKAMIVFFDYWLMDETCDIRIDPFISYVHLFLGTNTKCITGGCLYRFICMDYKGDIYPCGRIITQQYYMGNVCEINSIEEVFCTANFGELLQSAINRRNKCMQSCRYYQYCRGGCNSDAIIYGDVESNNHFACNVFRGIMKHIVLRVKECLDGKIQILNPTASKILEG